MDFLHFYVNPYLADSVADIFASKLFTENSRIHFTEDYKPTHNFYGQIKRFHSPDCFRNW